MKKHYSLKIEQVPTNPFINHFFEVTIDLIDDTSGLLKCGEEVPLLIKMTVQGVEQPSLLQLETNDPKISKTGFTKLKINILEPSMRFDNNEFFLEVCAARETVQMSITPAISDGMFAIAQQLIIDGGHVPKNWFKDRGGKDSYIELGVSMIGATGELVTHRRVPLKVTLLYESEEIVANQNILSHSADTKLQIDSTGRTYIRFRIGEVSRNHQKQSFCLKIAPDTYQYPLNNDISPIKSDSVEVLSKPRSGKDKKEEPISTGKRKEFEDIETDLPRSTKKEKKRKNAAAVATSSLEDSGIAALLNASMSTSELASLKKSQSNVPLNPVQSTLSAPHNISTQDAQRAFTDLMKWTKMVMDELVMLKWRQVGVERMQDGSTEPLIVRKNPNLAIDNLVKRYNEYAVPNMKMLHRDMFHTSDNCLPDTLVNAKMLEEYRGVSFDDLPPNAPKMGQQHSLMSNPEDWPDNYLFTPSVMQTLQGGSFNDSVNMKK